MISSESRAPSKLGIRQACTYERAGSPIIVVITGLLLQINNFWPVRQLNPPPPSPAQTQSIRPVIRARSWWSSESSLLFMRACVCEQRRWICHVTHARGDLFRNDKQTKYVNLMDRFKKKKKIRRPGLLTP